MLVAAPVKRLLLEHRINPSLPARRSQRKTGSTLPSDALVNAGVFDLRPAGPPQRALGAADAIRMPALRKRRGSTGSPSIRVS